LLAGFWDYVQSAYRPCTPKVKSLPKGFRFTGLHWGIVAMAIAIAATVVGMVGFEIRRDRYLAIEDAAEDTASLATALEEHTRQIFTASDLLMLDILNDIDRKSSLEEIDRDKLHDKLNTVATGSTFIKVLAVVGNDGKRVASADTLDLEPLSFVDRPHYFSHEFQDNLGLYIGSPSVGVTTYNKGQPLLPITRRINDAHGKFAGIVYAGISIDYFLDFYRSLESQPPVDIRLMTSEGSLLVSKAADTTGQTDFFWHPLFKNLIQDHPSGTYQGVGFKPFTQEITSYRRVPGFQLVVTVSMDRDEVLAHWQSATKTRVLLASGLLLAIAVATVWLLRLTSQREALLQDVMIEKMRAEKASNDAHMADEAKSAFLANMSHEIRTPMNGIIGFSELLLEMPLGGRQKEYVGIVHDSARTLLALLNDLLDYSKIEAGKVDLESIAFDPAAVAQSVLSLFLRQAETKGVSLTLSAAPDVPKAVTGDANRIRQILTNLISNAIKFTEKGSVQVFLSVSGRGGDWAALRFAVKDNGMGISDEAKSHLFSRFSQADNSIARRFGGTGLGLAICKSLVDVMHGEIGVSSRLGEGSTFWFTLSLPVSATVTRPAEIPQASNAGRKGTVLVVDDVEVNRRLVSVILTSTGYSVDEAGSGRDAIARLKKGGVDAVLLDLQMPDMDGLETTARIRTLLGDEGRVPIVAMTANAMSGVIDQCLAAGMNSYVRKPATKNDLLNALAKVLPSDDKHPGKASDLTIEETSDPKIDPGVLDELESHIGRTKVSECVQLLIKQMPTALQAIKVNFAGDDFHALDREAHALTSPAGSLGLIEVSRLCREISHSARTDSPSRAEMTIEIEMLTRAVEMSGSWLMDRYSDLYPLLQAASA
jgi:hypothetical protein